MQLQKAISAFFKNNKYGSLVPIPLVVCRALHTDGTHRCGRGGHSTWEPETTWSPQAPRRPFRWAGEAWVAAGAGRLAGHPHLFPAWDTAARAAWARGASGSPSLSLRLRCFLGESKQSWVFKRIVKGKNSMDGV